MPRSLTLTTMADLLDEDELLDAIWRVDLEYVPWDTPMKPWATEDLENWWPAYRISDEELDALVKVLVIEPGSVPAEIDVAELRRIQAMIELPSG